MIQPAWFHGYVESELAIPIRLRQRPEVQLLALEVHGRYSLDVSCKVSRFGRLICGKSAYPPGLSVIADIAGQPGSAS
jgi:hypothetical protein